MGAICNYKRIDDEKSYTTRSIKNEQAENSQELKITTKSVNRTNQKCLLVFVDSQCNVEKNQFLAQSAPMNLGYKIQQYLDVQIKGKKMNPGEFILLDVAIPQFNFKHVAFLCINVWQSGNKGLQEPLQEDLENVFMQMFSKNIKSFCMTGFNNQFGIPKQVAHKAISRALIAKQKQFQSISVVCMREDEQNQLIEAVKLIKSNDVKLQKSRQSLSQSIKSDYF